MQNMHTKISKPFNQIGDRLKLFAITLKLPDKPTLLIIVLNLCITVPLAAILNVWIDEAYSLDTTAKDLSYAISQSIYYEIQPPLYFILLNLWRNLSHSILFARLFSIACIVAVIYLIPALVRRYLKGIHPHWITASVAFHPYTIWAAIEIRSYAFSILLSVLLLLFFFDGYVSEDSSKKSRSGARWLYGLTTIFALYTHYFLVCLLIANAVPLLLLQRWRSLRTYIGIMALVGLCFIPLLPFIMLHASGGGTYPASSFNSFLYSLQTAVGRVLLYALPTVSDWEALSIMRALRYVVLAVLALIVIMKRHLITLNYLILWVIALSATFVLSILLDMTASMQYAYRYAYPLFITTILSVFAIFYLAQGQAKRKILTGWAIILFMLYTSTIFVNYFHLAKEGDWKRVASYIMRAEKPNQPVLVFSAESMLPLTYYYAGINPLVPLPKEMSKKVYNLRDFVLNSQQEILTAIAKVSGQHDNLWLINGPRFIVSRSSKGACTLLDLNFNCQVLEDFVSENYITETTKNFYGANVRFLHKKQ